MGLIGIVVLIFVVLFGTPVILLVINNIRKSRKVTKEYFDKKLGKVIFAKTSSTKHVYADFNLDNLMIVYPKKGSLREAVEYYKENHEGLMTEWEASLQRKQKNVQSFMKNKIIIMTVVVVLVILFVVVGVIENSMHKTTNCTGTSSSQGGAVEYSGGGLGSASGTESASCTTSTGSNNSDSSDTSQ